MQEPETKGGLFSPRTPPPPNSWGHGGESAWLSGWEGRIEERREVREGEQQILLIGGKLYPLISPATLHETKAWGEGGRAGRQAGREGGLRWTFLGERRGCNTRRRFGVKPAGEDKRQPLRIEAAPEKKIEACPPGSPCSPLHATSLRAPPHLSSLHLTKAALASPLHVYPPLHLPLQSWSPSPPLPFYSRTVTICS